MSYDEYLQDLVDKQFYCDECEPQYIEPPSRYFEGLMNCQECGATDCPYWKEYNI